MSNGPLAGLRIVEIAGLGPTPFAAMCLADMGAEVVRIQRPGLKHLMGLSYDILDRSRGFVELDLKDSGDVDVAKSLISGADALIEGLRPGVMERLGLGPDDCAALNPRLVFGRMTGWGQHGPLANAAGHDINYIALSGALHAIGPSETPVVPLNLLGDFGGGGIYLAFGIVCALLEAKTSGKGQVVDAAITDGAAHLMAMIYGMQQGGIWSDNRADNVLDGAAPYYGVYRCACGGFLAVGAIEAKFYAELLARIGADPALAKTQHDRSTWAETRATFEVIFASKSRDAWAAELLGTDACVAPVLTIEEAYSAPHNTARRTFATEEGVIQPTPTPRLSRTPGRIQPASQSKALNLQKILERWTQ